jgi:hypothetical protein
MEHAKLFSYRTLNYKLRPYQKPFDEMSRSSIEHDLHLQIVFWMIGINYINFDPNVSNL